MPLDNTPKVVTLNKIGGANMTGKDETSETGLPEIANLIDILQKRNESVTLVVSAFSKVTNALIAGMDQLNGTDYLEDDINKAFAPVKQLHQAIEERHLTNEHKAEASRFYDNEFEKLRASLMTHKEVSKILMPVEGSFAIRDRVIGFGEKMSGAYLKIYLEQVGKNAHFFDDVKADQDVLGTDGPLSFSKLHKSMQAGIAESIRGAADTFVEGTRGDVVRIFGGHIGGTPHGAATDVGRGYSDTTAVNGAIAMRGLGENVGRVRYWKDVEGVMTADPKILAQNNKAVLQEDVSHSEGLEADEVMTTDSKNPAKSKAVLQTDVSYSEGLEMASAGSGLMQPDALRLASKHGIDLEVRNINNPESEEGTVFSGNETVTNNIFKAIISNPHIDTVSVKSMDMASEVGFKSAVIEVFARHGVSVDEIFTEGTSMTVGIRLPQDKSDRKVRRNAIREALADLKTIKVNGSHYKTAETKWNKSALAGLSVVGNELSHKTGVLSVISGVLGAYGINIAGHTHAEAQKRITMMISRHRVDTAVKKLHSIFVDGDEEIIDDFKRRNNASINELTNTYS